MYRRGKTRIYGENRKFPLAPTLGATFAHTHSCDGMPYRECRAAASIQSESIYIYSCEVGGCVIYARPPHTHTYKGIDLCTIKEQSNVILYFWETRRRRHGVCGLVMEQTIPTTQKPIPPFFSPTHKILKRSCCEAASV